MFAKHKSNGSASEMEAGGEATTQGEAVEQVVVDPQEQALRKQVHDNPKDFTAWTQLLALVDSKDIATIRATYTSFLERFPLCFGYWKKLAEHEQHHGDFQQATRVFEQGVQADTHDCHMWEQYIANVLAKSEEPATVRAVFERAVAAVGEHYHSHSIWDKFIVFEKGKEPVRATAVYRRVLRCVVGHNQRYLEEFKQWIDHYPLSQLITAEELHALNEQSGHAGQSDEEKKQQWSQGIESAAGEVLALVEARRPYEEQLKRTYFHFKPLDGTQLDVWREYLGFEERQAQQAAGAGAGAGAHQRVVRLYERCLIPCAYYVEFWLRYAAYLEEAESVSAAKAVLDRAAATPLSANPDLHIAIALHQEAHESASSALQTLSDCVAQFPTHLASRTAHVHTTRRCEGVRAAIACCEQAMAACEAVPKVACALAVHLSRLHRGDDSGAEGTQRALGVLEAAVDKAEGALAVWSEFLRVACVVGTDAASDKARAAFEKCCDSEDLADEDLHTLFTVYLSQLEGSCQDVQWLRAVRRRYLVRFGGDARAATSRKRELPDADSQGDAKRQRTEAAAPEANAWAQQQAQAPQYASPYQPYAAAPQMTAPNAYAYNYYASQPQAYQAAYQAPYYAHAGHYQPQ